ncbi:MAG: TRAP transporter small permease subunit [Rhizobiaceae bacterium]
MSGIASMVVTASNGVDRVCLLLAKAALVGMVAAIALQIVARYGFHAPPSWTEELARYLMVWGGLLGATAAFRRGIDPAVVSRPETGRGWSARFARTMLAVSVLLLVTPILYFSIFGPGFDLARSFLMRNFARTSSGLGINLILIAAAIPTFCTVILIHLAARLVAGPNDPKAAHATNIG